MSDSCRLGPNGGSIAKCSSSISAQTRREVTIPFKRTRFTNYFGPCCPVLKNFGSTSKRWLEPLSWQLFMDMKCSLTMIISSLYLKKLCKKLSDSVFPGAAAVNTFPILRYLPSWMPGAGFQQFAAESRRLNKEMREVPFEFVKQNMRDGVDSKSIVAKLLEANSPNDEAAIQEVAAAAYGAGADTSGSALASFFLAMAVHPDIQKKAQTEIDTVIGTHRLPRFEDRHSLPYIEALYREVMRWKPVGSLGVAHATTEDDIYDGYFIPKGTTVISNIWAMTRDESIYFEPERFNPDRFFTADGKLNNDDTILAFGFGRRICVGRHLADATIWGTIVSVLSTFNIAKAKDDAGNEIDIDPRYSDGMISHPEPFACSITPRSEVAKSLVQDTTETYDL
ncbi:O-methylsterigmatocystin oxidoreductase [Mycena sanguinolenta]|uniref:O-methylsterigmatocystin oxidoreductase n=1 Tax=Mycena sanguinolenta TaxID=230812 RepID=A0A8H6XSG4_9AGAR|nr:O-methylsterigmatocystin oxidoreductase [Mycena sanguinolenta]